MDQARSEDSAEVLDNVVGEGVATDAGDGSELVERDDVVGENGTSDLGLNTELEEEEETRVVKDQETAELQKISDTLCGVEQGTSYSSRNLVSREDVLETCVVIDPPAQIEHVQGKSKAKANESGLSKLAMKAPKAVSETDKNSCAIDINKEFSENLEGEMICRICHLASGQPIEAMMVGTANNETSTDLIQLGCACKDELGIAHSHCAEAWFKLKGNRLCEICGETAKNVSESQVINHSFMEEWNESRFIDGGNSTSTGFFGRCWRGQPFCNFLMACLVIAFVLPWFFRVNMF
ncbi:hypothetical protein HN51_038551 [Arachis hypogaea]|uniref:RING-CH-type domain-containing protein n=2 Tax=Arachis TaxID=3817 RepID=A0A444ZRK0_ARAHY|nr:uncharacterized protein LOC107482230 [Arachis duranensis]XP_025691851.1 uncharacterized protein LOC112792726 [Arachis hypogaea]QHO04297.1 uncharacterized protein DS421_13g439270 [Arachis hypogaea]QHO04298.1 uncharacterized protein DS421_13g439270 [Arachis hypogaea]RYR16804.1 hypothetical protein Ahy_B03g061692 isoform A [Arachis hypogaea]RYR16805.1 hypothetical protein Ahy_B03g061692 isoform B [Arachis hypogaea]